MSKSDSFEGLLDTLSSNSGIRQRYAVQAMGRLGDPRAVQPLMEVLFSSKRELQLLASRSLAKLGTPAILPLVETLGQEQGEIWALASAALVMIGSPAVPALLSVLEQGDDNQQLLVMGILGQIGDARAVKPLMERLGSETTSIYTTAAVALARIGEPAGQLLTGLLTCFDKPDLRRRAIEVLKQIGEPIIPVLLHRLYTGSDLERTQAGWMLGEIGEPCLDALVQALGHKHTTVRCIAAMALGSIGSRQAVPGLIRVLHDSTYSQATGHTVCDAAAKSLQQIDSAEARVALVGWHMSKEAEPQ